LSTLDRAALTQFVNAEIVKFHERRLEGLARLRLTTVLRKKNPYLFRAKNITTAAGFVKSVLNAFLSSAEEECFGQFLESLAIHVSQETSGGRKSSATGMDLEFDRERVRYVVAVKSGPNWGNSSQVKRLETDFRNALVVLRQARAGLHIQAVLGICYGRQPTKDTGLYRRVMGQEFWHFLSGDQELYVDIVEPIGYEARRHNDDFEIRKGNLENVLAREFLNDFCEPDGAIAWPKVVAFNSGNLAPGTPPS
jgi:hypothetical protein